MSKASSLVLILSGLAVAAFVLLQGDDPGEPEPRSQQNEVGKRDGDLAGAAIVAPQPRLTFRPTAPVPAPTVTPGPARATEAAPAFSAPVVVTLAPRQSEPALPPQRVAIPRDRDGLARELQKELRRVGCYDGELNGAWTPSTRRAMKAFTDRINASLPVEEPDAILYVMVQGQRDQVCGKPCPAGQGLSEDGRCQPSAILAKATRKGPAPATVAQMPKPVAPVATERPAPVISGWSTTSTAAAPSPTPPLTAATLPLGGGSTEGRMALAGPPGSGEAIAAGPVTGAEPAALPVVSVAMPRKQATTAVGPARSRDWSRNIFNPN